MSGKTEHPGYSVGCCIVTCMKLGAVMGEQGPRGELVPEGGDIVRASMAGSARQVQGTSQEPGRPAAEGPCIQS